MEAPEETRGRKVLRQGAGWPVWGQGDADHHSMSEEYPPKCHALMILSAHPGFWRQEKICKVSSLNFHGGSVKASELF